MNSLFLSGAPLGNELPVPSKYLNEHFKGISSIWFNEKTKCNIYKATHRLDGRTYAIKKVRIPKEFQPDSERGLGPQELQILTKFNHPNIVRYHHCWIEEEESKNNEQDQDQDAGFKFGSESKSARFLYMQMEFCTGTSLAQYLRENEVTPQKAKEIFIQILQGVKEIHSQGVIHRDLKPENIFLDHEGNRVKIGDFGLSLLHDSEADDRSNESKSESLGQILAALSSEQPESIIPKPGHNRRIVGTPLYCSPEQLAGLKYGKETDIFALGLIFYQILGFPKATSQEKLKLFTVLRNELDLTSEFEGRFPLEARIIKDMAYYYPSKRATIEEVLSRLTGAANGFVKPIPKSNIPVFASLVKVEEREEYLYSEGVYVGNGKVHIYVRTEGVKDAILIEGGITSNVLLGGGKNKGRKLRYKYKEKDNKTGQPKDPMFVEYLN